MQRNSSKNVDAGTARLDEKIEKMEEQIKELEKGIQRLERKKDGSTILILGGERKEGWIKQIALNEMIILDEDKWTKLSIKLPKEFATGGAVYLDDELFIFGGTLGKGAYKLDKNLKWTRLADMNEIRGDITNSYLVWEGSIWVFGGYSESKYLKSVEKYDAKKDKWIKMPDMLTPRAQAAVVIFNDKFYMCGGNDNSDYLTSAKYLNPYSGLWTDISNLPTPRSNHSVVSYEGNLILIGGTNARSYENTVYELSSLEQNERWKILPPMKQSRAFFSAAVLEDEIVVMGGKEGLLSYTNVLPSLDQTEIFDGQTWRTGPVLPYSCWSMSSVVIPPHFTRALLTRKVHS